jgi:hypothetical protein
VIGGLSASRPPTVLYNMISAGQATRTFDGEFSRGFEPRELRCFVVALDAYNRTRAQSVTLPNQD